jgi:hypothetical protein
MPHVIAAQVKQDEAATPARETTRAATGAQVAQADYEAETQQKRPAFDHEKLAATLSKMTGRKYTDVTLPFNSITVHHLLGVTPPAWNQAPAKTKTVTTTAQ